MKVVLGEGLYGSLNEDERMMYLVAVDEVVIDSVRHDIVGNKAHVSLTSLQKGIKASLVGMLIFFRTDKEKCLLTG